MSQQTTTERIEELVIALGCCWDEACIPEMVTELVNLVRQQERDRCLDLIDILQRRLVASKGRSWVTETEELRLSVWKGAQQLDFQ